MAFVVGESWRWDENPLNQPDSGSYVIYYGREFRHDGARQRYLNRELDPWQLKLGNVVEVAAGTYWSDYDGDSIYGDFTAASGALTNVRSFVLPVGRVSDPLGALGIPVTEYYHTDMIGTTRLMTGAGGYAIPGSRSAHTAFGQPTSVNDNHRYGYAGAWGYQAATSDNPLDPYLDFTFLHVGHRYYDPATGRFLQRDPIGIRGGFNVYPYVGSTPTVSVDPSGLFWWGGAAAGAAGGAIAGARGSPYTFVACTLVGFILGGLERGDFGSRTGRGRYPRGKCTRGCHSQGR